jgi:hypothetical protein
MTRTVTAGTIVYRSTLRAAEPRTVHFDGTHSRVEQTDDDFGVRSLSIELRTADRDTVTYCKALYVLRFCVEVQADHPVREQRPLFEPLRETAVIAGLPCRKGKYIDWRQLSVWYSEEIRVEDPTGAVLQLEGVPGLILQTEDEDERVTVEKVSFDAPPAELFAVPPDYRRVEDIDVARAEDRRLVEARGAPSS